jgi:hypothetical protein
VLTVVPGAADADDPRRPDGVALIDEIVREGARRMLAEALQAEVDAYIAQSRDERDEHPRPGRPSSRRSPAVTCRVWVTRPQATVS